MSKTSEMEPIEMFDARGMREMYAFGAYFGTRRKYSGEIWAKKDDRLLVRFRCPAEPDSDEAYELRGITAADVPLEIEAALYEAGDTDWPAWVPHCVVKQWERWLSSGI